MGARVRQAMERHGIDVRTGAAVEGFDGRAVHTAAGEIETDLVISNAGPKATVALGGEGAFPPAYVEQVRNGLRPAANIVINIASREPLISHPGIVTFGKTRRLCNMANLTATCPELAPPGWHLYVAYAVPIPALGDFDSRLFRARIGPNEAPPARDCVGRQ